eukprot:gene17169-19742_t
MDMSADPECGCRGAGCSPFCVVSGAAASRSAGSGRQLSGIDIETMRAIAEKGGFQVAYHEEVLPAGWSWTEMLAGKGGDCGLVARYDLVAGGGWIDTSVRRALGVLFTSPTNNQGAVLAVRKPSTPEAGTWDNAFFWVKPYSWDAYLLVVFVWLFPTVLVWSLEIATPDSDLRDETAFSVITTALNSSFLNMTGFGEFEWPTQRASRLIIACWALLILIVLATYTANMTAFLVTEVEADLGVKS